MIKCAVGGFVGGSSSLLALNCGVIAVDESGLSPIIVFLKAERISLFFL